MAGLVGLLPELIVLGAALVIPLAFPRPGGPHARLPALLSLLALVLAAGLTLGGLGETGPLDLFDADDTLVRIGGPDAVTYDVSVFSALLKLLFLAGTALVVMASPRYLGERSGRSEYYSLLLLSTLGMMMVASSRDFITLFIGVETAAFGSYVLAGWFKHEKTSIEAATKYFITGALASTLTLYGITLIFGYTGEITFDGLQAYWATHARDIGSIAGEPVLVLGVFLVLAGLGFKMTVAPFHMWAPDVYTGSPDTVAAFLGGVSKGLGAVALFRVFLEALLGVAASWQVLVAGLAILTMTIGNLVAIRQDDIKRMLAYSSIAQAGYILIVLPVATPYALAGGLFHTGVNILMKGGAFLVVAGLAAGGVGYTIQHYNGLARRNPWLAFSLAVFLLSLAGIPPLAGFASKFVLFSSAIDGTLALDDWMLWLAVAGILNSAISIYYYARWIRAMYFEEPRAHPVKARVPVGASIAVGLSVLGIVVFGVWPEPALDLSLRAAAALFAP